MDGATDSVLILKAWLFLVLTIAILGNSKLDHAKDNQHAGRKLAEIPGFISIDCGSTEDSIENGITYVSDKEFIDTGITESTVSGYSGQLLKTLRSFPQGKRNCYTLRPDQAKNNPYLIRARFLYGNYDGKNQYPTFDLHLGVNKWITVKTDLPLTRGIIHVPTTDFIDVCLVNIGHGVPFISALDLRRLENSIYRTESGEALASIRRYDVGGSGPMMRYPEDVYDRFWWHFSSKDWIQIATNESTYTQSSDNAYKIPDVVLMTAAKTRNASIPLSYSPADETREQCSNSKCSVYFHFSEIEKLEPGQKRELTINLNGETNLTESVKLDYLNPQTIARTSLPVRGMGLKFSINAAEGTQFPPILNAFETFALIEQPNQPTAADDVEAIMEIKKLYRMTRNWQGDPCAPSEYSWDGLNCSNDNPPRIISLNLSSSNLTGEISASFSSLQAMQSLDLSYNDLTGPLPELLAQLQNLSTLDLRGNNLTGIVPDALLEKSRDGKLMLRLDENPDLCPPASCKRRKKKDSVIPIVASSIATVLVLLLIFSALAIYRRKRQGGMVAKSNIKMKSRQYSYSEVVSITNDFKTIIGGGGFGNVYLGTLEEDTKVAVKFLCPSSNQGYKEFQAEAQLLTIVHHQNLVSLVGYCDEGGNKALIYEYMANGNLLQHLSGTNANILSWNERLHIAADAAHGLEYLHNGCKPSIIHRDLKPSNILLNDHMQAKIADFGLSRAFSTDSDSHVSTRPAGTIGYLDPRSHATGNADKKSDVYSFGIILFELISGRPAIIRGSMEDTHILDWVIPMIERGDIQNIVDPRLGEFNTNSAWKAAEIAMSCTVPTAIQRPDMSQVSIELKECLDLVMAHGRSQRFNTEGRTLGLSLEEIPVDLESDIASLAR